MNNHLELQRQLDIENMELEQRIARAEAEERMVESGIISMKNDIFKLKASLVLQPHPSPSYQMNERGIDDLRLRIMEEKQRLLDISTRKRETISGAEIRKTELQRNIEIERSKDKLQSFMGKIGLVKK